MNSATLPARSVAADAVYGLLNPIPFGCFVAGLIFDAVYARTGEILWDKSAAWLIAIGLLFAVVPRLINLVQVWITSRRAALASDKLDFWLNLLAIEAADRRVRPAISCSEYCPRRYRMRPRTSRLGNGNCRRLTPS